MGIAPIKVLHNNIFLNAFPLGKFLAREPGIYLHHPWNVDFEHLSQRPSPITVEDASMCSQATLSKSLLLSEKTLSYWEETAIRGLEAVSVLDSSLGGLVSALDKPLPDEGSSPTSG